MTEAVILVGGKGTRLRPLTVNTPKPLLQVGGVPFLAHQLAQLREAGIVHVVLATSYRAEVFEQTFGDGSAHGVQLDYVVETEPLDTGGAIRNIAGALTGGPGDAVVVLNGDILSGHDLTAQLAVHAESDADVTLHLIEVEDARAFGCVPVDERGFVTAFLEKMAEPVTNVVNAGCYVFRRSVVDAIPAGRRVSVERETFPGLLAAGAVVRGYVESAYWRDLGNPTAYVEGSADLVLGRLPSAALPGPVGEALVLSGARVAQSAIVHGGSVVAAGAVVGPGATVDASVLLDDAVVGEGAVVRRSTVGAGARVGARTTVTDAVVGDGADTGVDNELAAGLRLWTGAVLADHAVRFAGEG